MDKSTPPPTQIPPQMVPGPQVSSFPRQAATFSLLAPLVSFCIGIFLQPQVSGHRLGMLVLGLISTLLIIAGFVLGILALVATKRHGRAGIFGKAVGGACINGFLIVAMVASIPGWMRAIERAKAKQKQQMEQRQP